MRTLRLAFIVSASVLSTLLTSCAELNSELNTVNSILFTDQAAETREAQQVFDRRKREIEADAQARRITWAESARRIREVDRSLAGQGRWKFDSDDEEYHAYCILAAEQVDLGKISVSYYDALRTRRFNEIQARRK